MRKLIPSLKSTLTAIATLCALSMAPSGAEAGFTFTYSSSRSFLSIGTYCPITTYYVAPVYHVPAPPIVRYRVPSYYLHPVVYDPFFWDPVVFYEPAVYVPAPYYHVPAWRPVVYQPVPVHPVGGHLFGRSNSRGNSSGNTRVQPAMAQPEQKVNSVPTRVTFDESHLAPSYERGDWRERQDLYRSLDNPRTAPARGTDVREGTTMTRAEQIQRGQEQQRGVAQQATTIDRTQLQAREQRNISDRSSRTSQATTTTLQRGGNGNGQYHSGGQFGPSTQTARPDMAQPNLNTLPSTTLEETRNRNTRSSAAPQATTTQSRNITTQPRTTTTQPRTTTTQPRATTTQPRATTMSPAGGNFGQQGNVGVGRTGGQSGGGSSRSGGSGQGY